MGHHIALPECRSELGLDVGIEGLAVHGMVDYPRRRQAIATRSGNEGLGRPASNGAPAFNRVPRRAWPRSQDNLVVVPVSSRKISRRARLARARLAMRLPFVTSLAYVFALGFVSASAPASILHQTSCPGNSRAIRTSR
jgi:hypothetical protein